MGILRNSAQCRKCSDNIESRGVHDFVTCKCGSISVDGGRYYLKRSAKDMNDLIDTSIIDDEEVILPPRPTVPSAL
jgi:hypothetical protein